MNFFKKNVKTVHLVRAAVIAALYVALTFIFAPISFGPIQFRISEALTILPLIFPEAILGLFIGCLLANMLNIPIDMLLGSTASLIAACLTFVIGFFVRKHIPRVGLGIIPPILVNALIVPIIIIIGYDEPANLYWTFFGSVFVGQATVIAALGVPLYFLFVKLTKQVPTVFGNNLLTRCNNHEPESCT